MISIIIPVLNEEKTITDTLKEIFQLQGEREIILVDGGSTDKTIALATSYSNIIIINSKAGRALQMNSGAEVAKGDILWFVHADSKISINSIKLIEDTIQNDFIGGCFSLKFHDSKSILLKIIAGGSNLRAKIQGLIFGDQGFFIKKSEFHKMGGYPLLELMEDFEFSRRVSRIGRLKVLKAKIGTSSRRFTDGGIIKTFLLMQKLKILYLCGVSPVKLKKMYKESR